MMANDLILDSPAVQKEADGEGTAERIPIWIQMGSNQNGRGSVQLLKERLSKFGSDHRVRLQPLPIRKLSSLPLQPLCRMFDLGSRKVVSAARPDVLYVGAAFDEDRRQTLRALPRHHRIALARCDQHPDPLKRRN